MVNVNHLIDIEPAEDLDKQMTRLNDLEKEMGKIENHLIELLIKEEITNQLIKIESRFTDFKEHCHEPEKV